jgi:hypothetical protein
MGLQVRDKGWLSELGRQPGAFRLRIRMYRCPGSPDIRVLQVTKKLTKLPNMLLQDLLATGTPGSH